MKNLTTKGLKLTAEGPTEQRILEYLKKNASVALTEKISAGKKTICYGIQNSPPPKAVREFAERLFATPKQIEAAA